MAGRTIFTMITILAAPAAHAEIIAAASDHYELRHEADSSLSPSDLWRRLISPQEWWSPGHTYSGSSANLSLDARPGGLWLEEWEHGAVAHGQVLSITHGKQLRLNAPFGPLQGMAVETVWTITISAKGEGSTVVFHEIANGSAASNLDQLAPAVDGVKSEAIARLIQ